MRVKANQGVRVPVVVAAGLLGLLAGVVACGSEAPEEKTGEGLGASKGGKGGTGSGVGGSPVLGVGGSSSGGSNSIPAGGSAGSSGSSGSSGSGGLDTGNACAVTQGEGDKQEVALLFMVDISGSMRCPIPEQDPACTSDPNKEFPDTRWKEMSPALKDFFESMQSDGMWAGISFFSRHGSCDAKDYEKPDAEIALLPGASGPLGAAIDKQSPSGTTPTVPSLTGAITHATAWAASHTNQQVVIVYATDGYPMGCSGSDNTIDNAAKIAKAAFDGKDNIRTYVLGVGPNLTDLNKIAASGGTQQALLIDPTKDLTTELATKFDQIRSAVAIDCVYNVPSPPAGQNFDGRVNVNYTNGAGKTEQIGLNDAATCSEGWQYTDLTQKQIKLCGTTCDTVKADAKAKIEVLYGCSTVHVGDPR
jgi:hypothetical protein